MLDYTARLDRSQLLGTSLSKIIQLFLASPWEITCHDY